MVALVVLLSIVEECCSAKYTPTLQLDDEGLTNLLDNLSLPDQRISGYRVDRSYYRRQWAYNDRPAKFENKYYGEVKPKGRKHHPLFNGK